MNNTPNAIVAEGLVRHFGSVRAVDGVDLAVRKGEVFGFLGPNGAGKTTVIRMLITLACLPHLCQCTLESSRPRCFPLHRNPIW